MNKTLNEKKAELEKLRLDIQKEEAEQKRILETQKNESLGLFKPLESAIVKNNIWYLSERSFQEIGDGEWYTASQILGSPTLKKGDRVVLMRIYEDDDSCCWILLDETDEPLFDEMGLEDSKENRRYLSNITKIVNNK
jgi:hypothetical protein